MILLIEPRHDLPVSIWRASDMLYARESLPSSSKDSQQQPSSSSLFIFESQGMVALIQRTSVMLVPERFA